MRWKTLAEICNATFRIFKMVCVRVCVCSILQHDGNFSSHVLPAKMAPTFQIRFHPNQIYISNWMWNAYLFIILSSSAWNDIKVNFICSKIAHQLQLYNIYNCLLLIACVCSFRSVFSEKITNVDFEFGKQRASNEFQAYRKCEGILLKTQQKAQ